MTRITATALLWFLSFSNYAAIQVILMRRVTWPLLSQ